ncbi:MAG: substrate-binding domain-containing protein [Chloroflexi bacterium]|nr:substrate-binding domain-containing protein [Chloroflexota bacterium]
MEQQQGTFAGRLTIGYLAPNVSDGIGQDRWHGVLDVAQERGVNLICFPGSYWCDPGPNGQANVLYELLSTETLDGLVLGNVLREDFVDSREFQSFHKRLLGLPAVSLREAQGIPYVPLDNYQGMREAILHLVEVHKVRRIAFLRGPEDHPTARERYQAYLDVLQEVGLPLDPDLVTPPSDWNVPSFQVLFDERKLSPPAHFEAIVAANGRKALDALRTCQARGIHVPEDVAIVGSNDSVESRATTPPLTSVAMPFYEQGRRATEMLLAMLAGEQTPEQEPLPARLVVRQSCGCMSPNVARAAAGSRIVEHGDLETAVQMQRDTILAEMAGVVPNSRATSEWAEHLLDAFVAEVTEALPGSFLSALSKGLRLEAVQCGNVAAWQGVVSVLRHRMLPYLHTRDALSQADGLWHQARVLIGEAIERDYVQRALAAQYQAETLRGIGQALIASFGVKELTEALAQDLPRLQIPSCYLSLYEDPKSPAKWSRLILAYDREGKAELEPGGRRFPSTQLVPKELFPSQRHYAFVVDPLYFQEHQLGFVLFEMGPREGSVYEVLRGQISSVLQGAALIEQVESRALLIQATAEVSQVASGILDPGELTQKIVNLIRERFDLYYVGLFLVQEDGSLERLQRKWAALQAGTGEAGREMLKQNHRLQVGSDSMIGQCVAMGQVRIAQNVDEQVVRFSNPFLPETCSELALPLISRGQTIGALSIQSSQPAAFSEEAIAIFQTMASQLAHSIENAYLLEETRLAMEELRAVQRRYIREGWSRYLDRGK